MIHPQKGMPGKYLLLDGHMRHHALKELGEAEADCLISTQDESYTYNARVNRLNPIQEHKMIMRAVKTGVQPERIAAALNLPVENTYCSAGRSGDSSLRRQNPPLPLPPGSFS